MKFFYTISYCLLFVFSMAYSFADNSIYAQGDEQLFKEKIEIQKIDIASKYYSCCFAGAEETADKLLSGMLWDTEATEADISTVMCSKEARQFITLDAYISMFMCSIPSVRDHAKNMSVFNDIKITKRDEEYYLSMDGTGITIKADSLEKFSLREEARITFRKLLLTAKTKREQKHYLLGMGRLNRVTSLVRLGYSDDRAELAELTCCNWMTTKELMEYQVFLSLSKIFEDEKITSQEKQLYYHELTYLTDPNGLKATLIENKEGTASINNVPAKEYVKMALDASTVHREWKRRIDSIKEYIKNRAAVGRFEEDVSSPSKDPEHIKLKEELLEKEAQRERNLIREKLRYSWRKSYEDHMKNIASLHSNTDNDPIIFSGNIKNPPPYTPPPEEPPIIPISTRPRYYLTYGNSDYDLYKLPYVSRYSSSGSDAPQNWGTDTVQPNAYGLGTGMNQYGQPVRYQVIGQPDADTSLLQVKPNAYGLGVGMDQFGRPVRVVPAR